MRGGLRYESARELPLRYQEQLATQILEGVTAKSLFPEPEDDHPCGTCLRWSECNGIDAENCPLCG